MTRSLDWCLAVTLTISLTYALKPPEPATLVVTFGSIALGLATLGIYGLMSHAVVQRTNEIGVRLAIGARRFSVFGIISRQGLKLATVGLVLGVPIALGTIHMVAKILDVATSDATLSPFAMIAPVVPVLIMVALVASYVPAFRATRIDPLTALRSD